MIPFGSFVKKGFPAKSELRLVFGSIVFLVFSWSIRIFIFELPSQMLNTRWVDILINFLVLMATALLESMFILTGLVLLSVFLPGSWFRNSFVSKSFATLLVLMGFITWIRRMFPSDDYFPPMDILYRGGIVFFILWVALLVSLHYVKPLQRFAFFIEERVEVFLYLYVPLGVIGFLAILVRSVVPR